MAIALVHTVWGTYCRKPILRHGILEVVMAHISENALVKGILIDTIGGYTDHLHLLIAVQPMQKLPALVMLIKGESSRWVNQQDLIPGGLAWAKGYFAEGISQDRAERLREYIRNQQRHHARMTFNQEYKAMMKAQDIF